MFFYERVGTVHMGCESRSLYALYIQAVYVCIEGDWSQSLQNSENFIQNEDGNVLLQCYVYNHMLYSPV